MGYRGLVRIPRQERARRTRARLLDRGAALFSRGGYAQTTAAAVARAAAVSTGSFYQYFPNKDALLAEIARERMGALTRALGDSLRPIEPDEGATADALRGRVEAIVDLVWRHHADDPALHATVTERRHADPGFDAACADLERAQLAHAARFLASLGLPGDVRPTALVLFAMIEGTVHGHVLGARPLDDGDALRARLVEAVLRVVEPDLPTVG